jgi:hypothetical protein
MAGQVGLGFVISANRMVRRRQDYGGTSYTGTRSGEIHANKKGVKSLAVRAA